MMIVFVGFLWILFVRTCRPEESTLQIGLEIRMDFRKLNLENVLISNDFSIIIFNRICCRSLHFSLLIPKGFQGVNGGLHGEMSEWFMVQLSKSSRSVDDPSPKTLDIAGFFGLSTFF